MTEEKAISSKEQGPWWTPTVEVERLMAQCKGAIPGTMVIHAHVLEGLCWDSLKWREERARISQVTPPTPETKPDDILSRIVACLEPKEPGWRSVHVIEGHGEQFWSALADLFARKGAQETSTKPIKWAGTEEELRQILREFNEGMLTPERFEQWLKGSPEKAGEKS